MSDTPSQKRCGQAETTWSSCKDQINRVRPKAAQATKLNLSTLQQKTPGFAKNDRSGMIQSSRQIWCSQQGRDPLGKENERDCWPMSACKPNRGPMSDTPNEKRCGQAETTRSSCKDQVSRGDTESRLGDKAHLHRRTRCLESLLHKHAHRRLFLKTFHAH